MKIKLLKLKKWLLMSVMGALGLSGCKSVTPTVEPEEQPRPMPRPEIRVMYGVPTMNYMIRGQVHDADGQPIGDIRINMLEPGMVVSDDSLQGDPELVQRFLENTAVTTDSNGQFVINRDGERPQSQVRLLVRDVDGEVGGAFRDRLVEVDVDQASVDRTGAGGWNQGTFSKEVEISLERNEE